MTDAKKPMAEANRISTIRFMQDIPLSPADKAWSLLERAGKPVGAGACCAGFAGRLPAGRGCPWPKKTAGERPVGRSNPPRRERLQDRVKENSHFSVLRSAYLKLTLLLWVVRHADTAGRG